MSKAASLEIPVLFRRSDKFDNAGNGKIDGLLIEGVGGHAEEQAQVIHFTFRNRQNVPTTRVADRRAARILFILPRNQGITAKKGLRTAMAGWKHAPDFIYQQSPGDRLMRFLVRIPRNWHEEFALHPPLVHNPSLPR